MPSASIILPTSFCFCAAEKTISSVRYPGSICIPAAVDLLQDGFAQHSSYTYKNATAAAIDLSLIW